MKQKILIVDDKPENLYTLDDFITENLDVEVVQADNGNDALKKFLHHNFSLAILDVQMPEMDGYELAKYIRIRNESRGTPIIFLSAVYSDDFHVFKGYDSGGVDFITKPFNPQLLLNKINFFLRLKAEEIKRKKIENHLAELIKERTEELEKAKKEAESANQAKSNFLATMSHEIRTPMHAVLGMTDMLKDTNINELQTEYVITIHQAGELLLSIIDDILDFSKIEAGKFEFEKVDFNLEELITGVIDLYDGKALEKGITLLCKSNFKNGVCISADSVRIKQILNNLINNAIKFTENNGSVILDVKTKELENDKINIKFRVIDNGKGIDPDNKKLLFKPFSQEDNTITRRYGGSGLGLSIIKTIVDNYNGKIFVKSKLGKGTIFTVNLSLDRGNADNCKLYSSVIKPAKQIKEFSNLNILVAEDGKFNQKLINEMLNGLKCNFDIAENGKAALKLFKSSNYNIVLMDCQMPEMDGYEASTKIRAFEKSSDKDAVPIVALTANAIKGNEQKCIDSGMNYFLAKPFKKKELVEKLSFCIQNTQLSSASLQLVNNAEEKSIKEDIVFLDINIMKALYRDVGSEIYNLLDSYIEQTIKSKIELENCIKKTDYKMLSEVCHTLKGCSSYIGIKELTDTCDILAHNIKDLSKQGIEKKVNIVLLLIDKTIAEIKNIIENKSLG